MIEPTARMVQLIYARINFVDHDDSGIAEGLADVFAELARDYCLERRGHVWHPLARDREVSNPCLCGADLGPPWDSVPHQRGTRGCRSAP